ncbi:NERD domain-containing protein/DEAD/DEAH box helicase [soil metagenome]
MAIMIPDACPSRATQGEKRTYALLRDALPDHFHTWYEPDIRGRHPDFTVLADDFGLLLLEVKGWYAGQIARVNDHEVELHRTEAGQVQVEVHKNPNRQVREYVFALMDELARPEYAILHNLDGEHRGKLGFPCGHGVILTNISREQLAEAELSAFFPPERALCRDELTELARASDRAVIRRLKQLFPAPFPFEPLTEDQSRTIKGVLHKEVIVRRRPATPASVPGGQGLLPGAIALDVLDAQQEQLARSMDGGHHVVFGIAGSGKTVLLLARARLFIERDPAARVLVLCYNKALAAFLADQLAGDPKTRKIEVRNFHSWAARKTGLRLRDDEPFDDYEARVVGAMLRGLDQYPDSEKYDAILIDEGHDFAPDWFRIASGMLRGGAEGDLLIGLDAAQSLYGRSRSFTWKSVGVQAQGRSRRLSRNYRNTKPILEFAWQVAQSLVRDEGGSETHVRVLPEKASRQGPIPRYKGCATVLEEQTLIVRLVAEFRSLGLADREIAVLYPRRERDRIEALCRRLREDFEVCWVSNESDPAGGVRSIARAGVRLLTIHSSKGLEFPAVIVSAVDLLPNPMEPDEVRDSNLLYVGLTRAIDHLAVTWSGRSRFTDRILRSTKAQPLPGE